MAPTRSGIQRTVDSPSGIDRKLLDEIFGDVLPDTTGDERGSGSSADGYSEQWYRDNRPPHHGG